MSSGQHDVCNGSSTMVDLPFSDEYLATLSTGYVVGLSVIGALVVAMVGLYIEEMFFFLQHLHNWKPKDKAMYLLGLYPVYGFTSFIALLVPRSSELDDLVASLYLSVCVYLFVVMLIGHFGGAEKMVRRLSHQAISLRSPPFCCCCVCLPNLQITGPRLQVLELIVLQYAVVKPILSFIGTVLWMDGKYVNEDLSKTAAYTWLNFFNIISTLTALYGFAMVYKVSHAQLVKMCVKPKFLCLQLVIIFSNFQHVIIGVFVKFGVVPCDPPLSAKANGDRWHHIILIVEMFIISLFARSYYRRHVGELPPEEKLVVDTESSSTEVTDTLTRRMHPRYGSTGPSTGSVYVVGHADGTVDMNDTASSSSDEIPMITSLAAHGGRGGGGRVMRSVATGTEDLEALCGVNGGGGGVNGFGDGVIGVRGGVVTEQVQIHVESPPSPPPRQEPNITEAITSPDQIDIITSFEPASRNIEIPELEKITMDGTQEETDA